MKKICFFVGLMMIGIVLPISVKAQNYDKMWREVEALQKKDLPRSVIEKSENIFSLALAKKNIPQMIKAFMVCSEYKVRLSSDSIRKRKDMLKKWAASEQDVVGKAVLNSIMAMNYAAVSPSEVDSVISCLQLSLKEKDLLASYSAALYYPVVVSKELSKEYFDDNMYDFLARQAVRTLLSLPARGNEQKIHNEILGVYDSLIDLYSSAESPYRDREAEALTREARLVYLSDNCVYSKDKLSPDEAVKMLDSLASEYKDIEVYCDIMLKLANKYSSQGKKVEAMTELKKALALYPNTEWTDELNNTIKEIESPSLEIRIPFVYPGYRSDIEVSYRNLTSVTIEAYRLGLSPVSERLRDRKNYEQLIRKHGDRVAVNNFTLPATADYKSRTTRLKYKLPEDGIYMMKLFSKQKPEAVCYEVVYVSPYQCIVIPLPGDRKELVAVDRMTGHPVPGTEIVSYALNDGKYELKNVYPTDEKGCVVVSTAKDKLEYFSVRTSGNDFMNISNFYSGEHFLNTNEEARRQTTIFTDRSIYRPGQMVYVSGVKYVQKGDSVSVLKGEEVTVSLTDTNGKEVEKKKVVTDDFGVYSAEFVLKQNVLPGYFGVKADNAYSGIRVEEYKRPTFDVVFEKNSSEYSLGDSVHTEARAASFAGAPLRMAKVEYRVVRMENIWWRYNGTETEISTGETMTDADGKFHIDFCLDKPDGDLQAADNTYYRFNVKATVTSLSGETQVGEYSVSVGDKSLDLSISDLPSKVAKERIGKIRFDAFNCERMPVETTVRYSVFKLDEEGKIAGKAVFSGEEKAQNSFVPYSFNSLSSGKYRIRISASDYKGREVTKTQDFVLFSLADSIPPYRTVEWFYQDGDSFDEGRSVDFYIGSSESDVYMMLDVFTAGKRLESRRITFSNSIQKFSYRYKEEYGDGITVCFSFMRLGVLYKKVVSLVKPEPEKKLNISWETFRDKLVPGQKEEWKLTVKNKDGEPVNASMLASAYDASLDELYSHGWHFGLYFGRKIPRVWMQSLNVYDNPYMCVAYAYVNGSNGSDLIYGDGFTQFIPFSWGYYGSRGMIIAKAPAAGNILLKNQASSDMMNRSFNRKVSEEEVLQSYEESSVVESVVEGVNMSNGNVSHALRENFSETAFYYPHLRTDSAGTVTMSFVMPDALTEWTFNGFVHTQNMDYGFINASFTTSKPFMVQPNMPRFVRVGDESSISSSLINMSDEDINGKVTMTLSNPVNGQVVYTKTDAFSVREGETGAVTFSYKVSEGVDVLVCTIMAEAGEFSDGERHYLPVLSDKQMIVENIPVQLRGDETKTVSTVGLFNGGSNTATNRKLTIEMTANPQWYVIQALPVLGTPSSDDAMSWAAALYANSLSLHIVKSNPKIRQVFDLWMAQGKNEKDLWSELSKNEQLKNIIIEETPWLADAQDDASKKQRIAMLFDVNAMNDRLSTAVASLAKLQLSDGSWPWFKGMTSSTYITLRIMESLARLKALGISFNYQMNDMYKKALGYLASEAARCHDSMLENKNAYVPQNMIMSYLYICAIDDEAAASADTRVNNYFIDYFVGKSASLDINEKSVLATVMDAAGKKDEAKVLLQSVMEYMVSNDEMGSYFDTYKAGYSSFDYRIPVHVSAMEAIMRLGDNKETLLDDMRLWLLKQKQVQVWDTPVASVNAIYAFLASGSDVLDSGSAVIAEVTGKTYTTPDDAIGHVSVSLQDSDIRKTENIEFSRKGTGAGWASVCSQCLESIEKVKSYNGEGLRIERKYICDGKEVSSSSVLSVGDKVTVCITVSADRDMDFVRIKDEKPSCLEVASQLSSYSWAEGLSFYRVNKDASVEFFIDRMRKGSYTIRYDAYVARSGKYVSGPVSVISVYAPQFGSHGESSVITIK